MEQVTVVPSQHHMRNERFQDISITNHLDDSFSLLFPENSEETKIQKARKILEDLCEDQSDEMVQIFLTQMQCFIDSWMDCFEKRIFDGLTLSQILKSQ